MATKDRTSLKNDFANGKYATGEKFADLIDSMKVVQLPVVDPQALGTSLSFIDSISQDADGKITATKKTLDLANAHELNPFKGWYKTGDTLPTDGFDGAYLYFKDTTQSPAVTTIYQWNGTTYANTGTEVDESYVNTFGSGQALNVVSIVNNPETGGTTNVPSAELVKTELNKKAGKTDVVVSEYEQLSAASTIDGEYIGTGGNIVSFGGYKLKVYNVEGLTKVRITADHNMTSSSARQYAFYSSVDTFSSSTKVGTLGPSIPSGVQESVVVSVPDGALTLCVTDYVSANKHFTNTVDSVVESNVTDYARANRIEIDLLRSSISNFATIQQVDMKADKTDVVVTEYEQLSAASTINGEYVGSNGNISSLGGFKLKVYNVEGLAKVRITADYDMTSTAARQYAFYSSVDTFSSSTKVGTLGPSIPSGVQESVVVSVPDGALTLCVTDYVSANKHFTNTVDSVVESKVVDYSKENREDIDICMRSALESSMLLSNYTNKYAYAFDGENLYVAYNDGKGVEFVYWFKKCMANNLYTFYRVGYRSVMTNKPSTDGISSLSNVTVINATGSDNIGPLSMSTGGYVGGNHTYSDNGVKTAKTDSYIVYIDNISLGASASGFADVIAVCVDNIIYDPAVAPSEGDTILSVELAHEYVSYRINKNTIEVGVSIRFVGTTSNSVNGYYGMQSMMKEESVVLTPNGKYVDWAAVGSLDNSDFIKQSYPNFNRFIEKKGDVPYYQATYLLPDFGLGDKSFLSSSHEVFHRGSGKDYHWCLGTTTSAANLIIQWAGSYTFFTVPILDNSNIFAYRGTIRGKDAIFVSVPSAFGGFVPFPADLVLRQFSIKENQGFTNERNVTEFGAGGDGLYLVSTGSASMIIVFD